MRFWVSISIIPAAVFFLTPPPSAHSQFPPQIKNIVIVVQENRTPDNLFQYLTPKCPIPANADGLTACMPTVASNCYNIAPCGISGQSGTPVAVPLEPVPLYGSALPQHSHWSFEHMCDPDPATFKCRNDGAWQITVPSGGAYSYVENTPVTNYFGPAGGHLLDPYLTLARQYGWANYMFQTNQGASYPAHQYLFAGTSAATAADDAKSTYLAEDFSTIYQSGCLAPAGTTNNVIQPVLGSVTAGCSAFDDRSVQECSVANTALIYPTNPVGSFCHTHQSMADVLEAHDINWKYYASTAGSLATAPVSYKRLCNPAFVNPNADPSSALECTGSEWNARVDLKNHGADFFNDVWGCSLPRVSWVIPDDRWSDHAGGNDFWGPSWVAAIVNNIAERQQCPAGTPDAGQIYWQNTAILITWDDWGGWTDHEPPQYASVLPCKSMQCPGVFEHGFRVPLLVVSAYTPQGLISNERYDFGSILRMIEGVNDLGEGVLGFADARATTDLHEFFTLTSPRVYHLVPAEKNATFFLTLPAASPAITPDED
jgi:phospholipase C